MLLFERLEYQLNKLHEETSPYRRYTKGMHRAELKRNKKDLVLGEPAGNSLGGGISGFYLGDLAGATVGARVSHNQVKKAALKYSRKELQDAVKPWAKKVANMPKGPEKDKALKMLKQAINVANIKNTDKWNNRMVTNGVEHITKVAKNGAKIGGIAGALLLGGVSWIITKHLKDKGREETITYIRNSISKAQNDDRLNSTQKSKIKSNGEKIISKLKGNK